MIASAFAFAGGAALTLGAAYFMLRTMSMLKAGVALMGSALGTALLLFTLHADVVATMTIMMFGPAMLGMVLFMLMLMEDSGGFMMTSSGDVPRPSSSGSKEEDEQSVAMRSTPAMAHGKRADEAPMPAGVPMQMSVPVPVLVPMQIPTTIPMQIPPAGKDARDTNAANAGRDPDATLDADEAAKDAEPEVERAAAGILGPIGEIAPMTDAMDMEMTNSQTRWAGWLALAFFIANTVVVVATPWMRSAEAPSLLQPFLIGTSLLEKYMLVFEGCGFLILLAVIVATMAGRKART